MSELDIIIWFLAQHNLPYGFVFPLLIPSLLGFNSVTCSTDDGNCTSYVIAENSFAFFFLLCARYKTIVCERESHGDSVSLERFLIAGYCAHSPTNLIPLLFFFFFFFLLSYSFPSPLHHQVDHCSADDLCNSNFAHLKTISFVNYLDFPGYARRGVILSRMLRGVGFTAVVFFSPPFHFFVSFVF